MDFLPLEVGNRADELMASYVKPLTIPKNG